MNGSENLNAVLRLPSFFEFNDSSLLDNNVFLAFSESLDHKKHYSSSREQVSSIVSVY